MTDFYNYLIPTVHTPLNKGHVKASELLDRIKTHKGEGYHNLFDVEKRDTYEGYQGEVRPALGWFPLDFDSADLEIARKNVLKTWDILGLDSSHARLFFSGQKGFHLYIREEFFGFTRVQEFKNFALRLNNDHGVEIDAGIIQSNRKFRVPNSYHPKTGFYKIQLEHEQLTDWSIDQIKQFSKHPRAFNLSDFTAPLKQHNNSNSSSGVVTEVSHGAIGPGVFGIEQFILEDIKPKYFLKPCVTKMWSKQHGVGERHDVTMALIADSYEAGSTKAETTSKIREFCSTQGIADRFERDYVRAVEEQYDGRRSYSYGCYNTPKKSHCMGDECKLYAKLDQGLRARVQTPLPNSPGAPASDTGRVQTETPRSDGSGAAVKGTDDSGRTVKDGPATEPGVKPAADEAPSHFAVTLKLVKKYKGQIIKQDRDLFYFTGTHWEEASVQQLDNLKKEIHRELNFVQMDKLERCFKMFMQYVESVPPSVDLFRPNPNVANFLNGSLFVERKADAYTLAFRNHSRTDYLTSCVQANYPTKRGHTNTKFSELLEHLLASDPERDQKLLALKQIAGAMMLPKYPQICFLLGDSGSGKSTFVKTFYYALGGAKYASMVQPCQMKGFELEGMLHKTLNIHTDVDEGTPIPDSLLKSLGDRIPFQVNRKGKKVVQASLPAVHVYCANSLPPTKVKNQNVYDRRATIVRLDHVVEAQARVDQYEELILSHGTDALVEFAVEGIESLVGSGGFFTKPESSKSLTKEWQERSSDAIADFIDSARHNEAYITVDPTSETNRTEVFQAFSRWSVDQGYKDVPIKAAAFYRELSARGFRLKMVKGDRRIEGFKPGADSSKPDAAPSQGVNQPPM